MVSIAKFNSRIQLKSDTFSNWNNKANFIPLKGELIHYNDTNQIKIGDGVLALGQLPFVRDSSLFFYSQDMAVGSNNSEFIYQASNIYNLGHNIPEINDFVLDITGNLMQITEVSTDDVGFNAVLLGNVYPSNLSNFNNDVGYTTITEQEVKDIATAILEEELLGGSW